jgi:N-acetylglucosaminyldiphosphoundecaprenol N-acetyl-beta-D-mannosaminyltransferase
MVRAGAGRFAATATRPAGTPPRVPIGGLAFDNVDLPGALARVAELIAARRPALVVTPNVDHLVRAVRDPSYAALVAGAGLVLADGQPVVWAARLLGRRLAGRVAGSDLLPALCARAAVTGWRVFFLGGDYGVAERAREVLMARHPGLRIVGTYCPPMGFERSPLELRQAVEAVRAARPELVFVGLGSPKQERFIAAHMHEYGPAVSIGIGVSFSFVAGDVRRAPRWMQRLGLEWLHRLWQEPRRLWRRYLLNGWGLLPILARDLWWTYAGRRLGEQAARPEEREAV